LTLHLVCLLMFYAILSGALALFSKYNGTDNLQNGGFCHLSTRWSKNLSLLSSSNH
jgi:hypothetical protein